LPVRVGSSLGGRMLASLLGSVLGFVLGFVLGCVLGAGVLVAGVPAAGAGAVACAAPGFGAASASIRDRAAAIVPSATPATSPKTTSVWILRAMVVCPRVSVLSRC